MGEQKKYSEVLEDFRRNNEKFTDDLWIFAKLQQQDGDSSLELSLKQEKECLVS